jgi:hypothetical protein
MSSQPGLSPALKWWPWPPGDPAPEIWRIITDLDLRVQLQVVNAVLDTQIAVARAHMEGLQKIQKAIGARAATGAKRG